MTLTRPDSSFVTELSLPPESSHRMSWRSSAVKLLLEAPTALRPDALPESEGFDGFGAGERPLCFISSSACRRLSTTSTELFTSTTTTTTKKKNTSFETILKKSFYSQFFPQLVILEPVLLQTRRIAEQIDVTQLGTIHKIVQKQHKMKIYLKRSANEILLNF